MCVTSTPAPVEAPKGPLTRDELIGIVKEMADSSPVLKACLLMVSIRSRSFDDAMLFAVIQLAEENTRLLNDLTDYAMICGPRAGFAPQNYCPPAR